MDDAPSLPTAEEVFAQPQPSVSSTFLPKGSTLDIHGFSRHIGGKRDHNETNRGLGLTLPLSSNGVPSENWSASFGVYENSYKGMPADQKRHANGRTNTFYLMLNYERASAFKPFEKNTKYGISFGVVDYYGEHSKFEIFNTDNRYLNTVSAAFQLSATIQATDRLSLRAGLVPLKTLSRFSHQAFGTEMPNHSSNIVSVSAQWHIN